MDEQTSTQSPPTPEEDLKHLKTTLNSATREIVFEIKEAKFAIESVEHKVDDLKLMRRKTIDDIPLHSLVVTLIVGIVIGVVFTQAVSLLLNHFTNP